MSDKRKRADEVHDMTTKYRLRWIYVPEDPCYPGPWVETTHDEAVDRFYREAARNLEDWRLLGESSLVPATFRLERDVGGDWDIVAEIYLPHKGRK